MPRRWKVFLLIVVLSVAADQATKVWARHSLSVTRYQGPQAACAIPDDIVNQRCMGDTVGPLSGEKCTMRPPNTPARPGDLPQCDGVWQWRLSFNPGSAFGLFNSAEGARIFLSIVGILAVAGMIWMLRRSRDDQAPLHWALGLVAGGAIGNLIDRIWFGVVTDFVLWHYQDHEWPVFNVADVALVIGVGLMFLDIGKDKKKGKSR